MLTIRNKNSDSGMASFLGILVMSFITAYASAVAIGFVYSINTYKRSLDSNYKKDTFETELRLAMTHPLNFGESAFFTADSQEIKMRDLSSGALTTYIKSGSCYRDYLIFNIDLKSSRTIEVNSVKSFIGNLTVTYQLDPAACANANPLATGNLDARKSVARVPMFFVADQAKISTPPFSAAILEAYSTNLTTVSLSQNALCKTGQVDLANCKTSHEVQCQLYQFTDGDGNYASKYFDPVLKACMPRETWTR